MTGTISPVFLILLCQFGLSMQACQECACCKDTLFACTSNKMCLKGCIDGYYTEKCTKQCLSNCKTCVNGNECKECKPGYYSNKCNTQCGKGCLNSACSILSGECTCKSSYFTKGKCDACLGLRYGDECNNTCPINCGSCLSETGCSWCKNNAHYGSYCQYRCSVGCVDEICNKGTGYCDKGCKPGFVGYKCDMCLSGLYGPYCDLKCTENCKECLSDTNCTKCESDFYGDTCANACPAGCDKTCSFSTGQHCKLTEKYRVCEKDTGRCLHGCNLVTKFGDFCEKQCGNTCTNKSCDLKTGECLEGCEMIFYGLFCNNSCSTSCLSHTGKRSCDAINGHCLFGCKDGFYGKRCDNICSSLCVNTTCNQTTAECLYGCINGFKGPKCIEADLEGFYTRSTLIGSTIGTFLAGSIVVGIAALITFIVWRRRNIQTKQLEVHGYENTIGPCENRSNDDTRERDSPVTYEDLKSRDERLYSQIATSQQIPPPATDFVNYMS
ncbi:multiple epidermal growth factor-like domains protein 10 [Ruditapes philippinarum]|uniref:multiple epidermal growth factor-like domains protein 10 n=1 Tax=Ruditapes philippinarum TaxID=129788 RepID=UPI00295AE4E3|nr:multiple epidermal growth factor-like domains protein 10 [Ruditapes philippinarum]